MTRTASREEAMWLASISKAMQGDVKHIELILKWRGRLESWQLSKDYFDMMGKLMADEAVRQAKIDGRLPRSNSPKDLCLWAENRGYEEKGTWAARERVRQYLDSGDI